MVSSSKFRTKLCRSFAAGQCVYGDKCTFIHLPVTLLPPSNVLSPFARELVMNWSALRPKSSPTTKTHSVAPDHSVFDAPVFEAPQILPTLPGASTANHKIVHPKNWRTKPCKHFVRTNGWCPVGDTCSFIHDPALSSKTPDLIRYERDTFYRSEDYAKEPRSASNTITSAPQTHCWAYIQGMCVNPACQLPHPEDTTPYIAYTPCLRWPNCPNGTYCTFRHQVPIPVPMIMSAPLPLPQTGVTMPEMAATMSNPLWQVASQEALPCCAYEINGTTYFTPSVASLPLNPIFYDHATVAHNGYDSAPYAPSQHGVSYETSNYIYDQAMHPAVDRQAYDWSDPQVYEGNEPKEEYPVPIQDPGSPATPDLEDPTVSLTSTREGEFPYRPPKNQRVGHVRRISVQMKKVDTLSLIAAA